MKAHHGKCHFLLSRQKETNIQRCVKSVQIRSFFWSVFSCIRTEYRKIRTRKNSIFGYFSRSASFWTIIKSYNCKRLFGVHFDSKLNFDAYNENICQKANRKLNATGNFLSIILLFGCYPVIYDQHLSNKFNKLHDRLT